jgi:hypothetical protein
MDRQERMQGGFHLIAYYKDNDLRIKGYFL